MDLSVHPSHISAVNNSTWMFIPHSAARFALLSLLFVLNKIPDLLNGNEETGHILYILDHLSDILYIIDH